jgi:hypothetical protein
MQVRQAALVFLAITATLSLAAQAGEANVSVQTGDDPVQPSTPAPTQAPPPPSGPIQAPPAHAEAPAQPPVPGQWVYTDQYGWIWMPYGDKYTHVVPGNEPPDMYVYEPSYGWCWVAAPWIWGWGPLPFFGVIGPVHFGWWGNGYGHWYGFSGRYRTWGRTGWGGRSGWGGRPGWGGRSGAWEGRPGGGFRHFR